MKQFIRGILLSAVVASALLTGALAEDQTGIQNLRPVDPTAVTAAEGEDWLTVTYNNAVEYKEYLLIVQKLDENDEDALPTQSNIYYIDQKTASGNSVSFDVYPKTMTSGTYEIRVSSNDEQLHDGLQKVGSFTYNAPAPTVNIVNLTGDASLNPVPDGNVLTVTCDKACVVLCSANEENTEENSVKASVAEDWERLEAAKTEGEDNSYTFDLSGKTGTVVIAVKGDVNFDARINALDISILADHILNVEGKKLTELLKLTADVNGNGDVNALDISLYADDILNTGVGKFGW